MSSEPVIGLRLALSRFGDDIQPLQHPDAMVAMCYRIQHRGRPTAICKVHSRSADCERENWVLNRLQGILPIPRVLESVAQYNALVLEWLPGDLLSQAEITIQIAGSLGEVLAVLHTQRCLNFGDPAFPQEVMSSPLQGIESKFYEELQECLAVFDPHESEAIATLFEREKFRLDDVDGPCLIHRDFRPGNVLVNDGFLVAIIDWASARFGFAEQDLVSWGMEGWLPTTALKEAFSAAYASVRPLPDFEAIQRLLQLLRAVGVCGFLAKTGRYKEAGKIVFERHRALLRSLWLP